MSRCVLRACTARTGQGSRADALLEPPDDFDIELPIDSFAARRWYRVHQRKWDALYFDREATYRFNAPDGSLGVLYMSYNYAGALAETLLGSRTRPPTVTETYLRHRALAAFFWRPLRLVDFTGTGLARLGLDARIASGDCYPQAQRWSKWVHDHPEEVDGICYFARNAPRERSVALFERAGRPAVTEVVEESLMPLPGALSPLVKGFIKDYGVAILPG
jgi:hypothetical protein